MLVFATILTAAALAPPVQWEAPEGCPSQAEFVEQLRAALPGDLEVPPARFVVGRNGQRWTMSWIEPGDPPASRSVDADSCQALAEAALVIVSIAATQAAPPVATDTDAEPQPVPSPGGLADPTGPNGTTAGADTADTVPSSEAEPHATRELGDDGLVGPETATDLGPSVEAKRRPEPAERAVGVEAGANSRRRVGALLMAGAGVGLQATNATTATFSADAGATAERWSATAGVTHWLSRTRALAADADARVWLTAFDVRGCGHPYAGRWVLLLCGGGSVGVAAARSSGSVDNARRGRSVWASLRAAVGVRVWLEPRFGLFASAEPIFVVARPQFVVSGLGSACCDATVAFEGRVGAAARFGGPARRK